MRVRLDRRAPIAACVAAALVALALAGGGYSDLGLAVIAASVWLAVIAAALAGRLEASASPAFLTAAGSMLALLGLTVLSLSWASSDAPAFVEVVRVAGYLGVLVLGGMTLAGPRAGAAIVGIAAGIAVVAFLALGSRLLFASGDADLVSVLPSAAGRLSYPIGYWNALGALMALGLPPLAWIASAARVAALRGAALAGFAPLLLVAYMASSRGSLLAGAIGVGVVVAFAAERRRALTATLIGVAGAIPAVVVATGASGILDTAGSGSPGRAEAAVLAALAVGMLFAAIAGARWTGPLARSRPFAVRIPARAWPIAFLVVVVVGIAAAGPTVLTGDLGGGGAEPGVQRTVGVVSASGSGRTEFWGTALDAFAEEPVRGIGAGGYEEYWNAYGGLASPAKNAHSEPLEVLAELGLAGIVCLIAFLGAVVVAGLLSARRRDGGPAVAALGVVAAGLVGFSIDWTWEFPAVAVPFLVASALIVADAPLPERRRVRLPAVAVTVAVVVLGAGSIWAAGVLGAASSRLDASENALAAGRLDEAAAAARSAISIEPWAAEPWLRLAEVEQLAGNDVAALRAAREAIRLAPADYRAWILAARVEIKLGNGGAAGSYRNRGLSMYPFSGFRG